MRGGPLDSTGRSGTGGARNHACRLRHPIGGPSSRGSSAGARQAGQAGAEARLEKYRLASCTRETRRQTAAVFALLGQRAAARKLGRQPKPESLGYFANANELLGPSMQDRTSRCREWWVGLDGPVGSGMSEIPCGCTGQVIVEAGDGSDHAAAGAARARRCRYRVRQVQVLVLVRVVAT